MIIENEIIQEQQDEAIQEKLELYNTFIREAQELSRERPKSSFRIEREKYDYKLERLVWIWRDLREFLPKFTEEELMRTIEMHIRGSKEKERCFQIAIIFSQSDEPLKFTELEKKARMLKSFAYLRGSSMNKTLDRVLKDLKRIGLIVHAGYYYFRLIDLKRSKKKKKHPEIVAIERVEILEDYLTKILREIAYIKDYLSAISDFLSKTSRFTR